MILSELINDAKAFGSAACAIGKHEWVSDGGRSCPRDFDCSQTVYVCRACGQYDYGEKGGPGFDDCEIGCSSWP